MVIIFKKNASEQQINSVIDEVRQKGLEVHRSEVMDAPLIGLIGDTSELDVHDFLSRDFVASAERISSPYKRAARSFNPENSVVWVGQNQCGVVPCAFGDGKNIPVIAGPCSVENEAQILKTAEAVKASGAKILRGGAYKPRTSPYSFQGLGKKGLELLSLAKKTVGLPVCTEIMRINELEEFEDIDLIQVGARNFQNYDLLKELGKCKKPVLLKRGLSGTVQELLMSAEYIMVNGNDNVILCERGIRSFDNYTRNCLDLSVVPYLHRETHLPVIVDPSHACGIGWMVPELAKAAVALGTDGLEIEVHCNPEKALSDSSQQLTPEQFDCLMQKLKKLALVDDKIV